MKHLLDIKSLTPEEINNICIKASEFEKGIRISKHTNAHIANLFFENSTRTKLSFEMAENKILANKYNFEVQTSSINKGEDMFDTINNLSAIGMNLIVLRHADDNLIKELAKEQYFQPVSFVNAGSGMSAHPTQALLDYYTLKQHFLDLSEKTIAIVGDISHSRVAKSNIELLKKFNMNIKIIAPEYFMNEKTIGEIGEGVSYHSNLEEGLAGVDVVMTLRIQKERILENIDLDNYIKNYQITKENMPYASFLMHPGPINKNIEISEEVLKSPNAKTILKQAQNGVYIRMAILDILLSSQGL